MPEGVKGGRCNNGSPYDHTTQFNRRSWAETGVGLILFQSHPNLDILILPACVLVLE
jgi:hypothetical protein